MIKTTHLNLMILIKNKRTKTENILKQYPDAMIFDVTSKGEYKRLSPFYPHGGIPIPFSGTVTSASVGRHLAGTQSLRQRRDRLQLFHQPHDERPQAHRPHTWQMPRSSERSRKQGTAWISHGKERDLCPLLLLDAGTQMQGRDRVFHLIAQRRQDHRLPRL